jgi:hypothetical protein
MQLIASNKLSYYYFFSVYTIPIFEIVTKKEDLIMKKKNL